MGLVKATLVQNKNGIMLVPKKAVDYKKPPKEPPKK